MAALPNSHQALLRNRDRFEGRLAFLGLTHTGLLDQVHADALVMTDNAGILSLLQCREDCRAAFGYDDPRLAPGAADTVVVFLPKARAELSMRLALAHSLVAAGGRILLVGEKKEGIAGAVGPLRERLPQSRKLDSARHCQVWVADSVVPVRNFRLTDWLQWHAVESHGVALDVAGLPGIFSDGELDPGTAMLLDTLAAVPLAPGRTLDFACGAGVIGAWWQAFQEQQCDTAAPVDGVDVQFQAVACARATYERADARGAIAASEGLSAVAGQYQSVVTNPPFHTGIRTDTSVTEAFLQAVNCHLEKGGELRLVANRFLPYEPLIRRHVGRAEVLAEDRKFIVWSARRSGA